MKRTIAPVIIVYLLLFFVLPLVGQDISKQVLKIIATKQEFDYYSPWLKKGLQKVIVNGCIVDKNMILTSAYSIADHTMVEVIKRGDSKRYNAEVIVKDYQSGLALLTISDPDFFSDLQKSTLAEAKRIIGEKLKIYRWDIESNFREYSADVINTSIRMFKPNCAVLMHTMSTDMDGGGYGEPVFRGKELVGIATGFDTAKKNVFVIGVDTIHRMLKDFSDGRYEGVPFFWIDGIAIESDENLRTYLGLKENETGVYINKIHPLSSGCEALKTGDVIISINDTKLEDTGLYLSPSYGKLNYYGLIYLNHHVGDDIQMTVIRDAQKIELSLKLKQVALDTFALSLNPYDEQPEYVIIGGLLFQYLSLGYMRSWGSDWEKQADRRVLTYYRTYLMKDALGSKKIIVMNRVLPASVNSGYQDQNNLILDRVNGIQVKNLETLKNAVYSSKEKYIRFDFIGNTTIILDRPRTMQSEAEILRTYQIASPWHIKK